MENEQRNIVVLADNGQHFETRSWFAKNTGEAYTMVIWLRDNFITATQMTQKEWDDLNK